MCVQSDSLDIHTRYKDRDQEEELTSVGIESSIKEQKYKTNTYELFVILVLFR